MDIVLLGYQVRIDIGRPGNDAKNSPMLKDRQYGDKLDP